MRISNIVYIWSYYVELKKTYAENTCKLYVDRPSLEDFMYAYIVVNRHFIQDVALLVLMVVIWKPIVTDSW